MKSQTVRLRPRYRPGWTNTHDWTQSTISQADERMDRKAAVRERTREGEREIIRILPETDRKGQ